VRVVLVGNKSDLASSLEGKREVLEAEGQYVFEPFTHASIFTPHALTRAHTPRTNTSTCVRTCRQQAQRWGVPFCECSAKTGEGVPGVFEAVLASMMSSGWQIVAGMATPAHVPSEALLAQLIALHSPSQLQEAGGGAREQWQCVLQ
jgi:GTPase SAR1 family protein